MRAIERQVDRAGLGAICAKVREGRRLHRADGLRLYQTPDLTAVGFLANLARERLGADRTFYVRNLHINYINVCWV